MAQAVTECDRPAGRRALQPRLCLKKPARSLWRRPVHARQRHSACAGCSCTRRLSLERRQGRRCRLPRRRSRFRLPLRRLRPWAAVCRPQPESPAKVVPTSEPGDLLRRKGRLLRTAAAPDLWLQNIRAAQQGSSGVSRQLPPKPDLCRTRWQQTHLGSQRAAAQAGEVAVDNQAGASGMCGPRGLCAAARDSSGAAVPSRVNGRWRRRQRQGGAAAVALEAACSRNNVACSPCTASASYGVRHCSRQLGMNSIGQSPTKHCHVVVC